MPPTLHLVRHAQGYHNLSVANQALHDPLLTPYGRHQCTVLQNSFPYAHVVDLVVASPIKRTLYTALKGFAGIIRRKGLQVIAIPELQETSDLPCDTGSPLEVLEKEFEGQPVDLRRVVPGWDDKMGRWSPDAEAIEERCRAVRQWLRGRKEEHIVVVTHGGVLHYLTEDWADSDKFNGTGWANTEFRSYTFDPQSGADASVIETAESRRRRRGAEKPLTESEQRHLKLAANDEFERKGYVKHTGEGARLQAKLRDNEIDRDWIGGFQ